MLKRSRGHYNAVFKTSPSRTCSGHTDKANGAREAEQMVSLTRLWHASEHTPQCSNPKGFHVTSDVRGHFWEPSQRDQKNTSTVLQPFKKYRFRSFTRDGKLNQGQKKGIVLPQCSLP